LGSGASITAVKDGKSFDTSMGFTPLAGLEMGTRTGDLDPSVIAYLMHKQVAGDLDELFDVLNHQSGLLGVSGLSSDMRDVRDAAFNGNKRAKLAFDMFTRDIVRYIGAYYTEMGGADAIIFTAGIGEHEIAVRQAILEKLDILGLQLDEKANAQAGDHQVGKADSGDVMITTPDSKLKAYVIPTNEELLIERDVVRLTNIK
jgi:acetate kinase